MICSLSLKSLCFDKLMSLSIMMAMTAIIAPLLLLFSLRYGIITKAEHDMFLKKAFLQKCEKIRMLASL